MGLSRSHQQANFAIKAGHSPLALVHWLLLLLVSAGSSWALKVQGQRDALQILVMENSLA